MSNKSILTALGLLSIAATWLMVIAIAGALMVVFLLFFKSLGALLLAGLTE